MKWIAITGLLLPLALHLWNRKQGREVRFGSIQWLIPSEEKRMSSIKFTDIWLYLIRTLLVLGFVLLLMDLGWWTPLDRKVENNSKKWVLVEKELYQDQLVQKNVNSLLEEGYALRYFEEDFPLVKGNLSKDQQLNSVAEGGFQNYWSLLKSIDNQNNRPDTVALFAIPKLSRFQGERPIINYHLQWWPLPFEKTSMHLAKAIKKEYEELELVLGKSNENINQWERFTIDDKGQKNIEINNYPVIEKVQANRKEGEQLIMKSKSECVANVQKVDTVNILLLHDASFRKDLRYLQAALRVVNAVKPTELILKSEIINQQAVQQNSADWVFWLSTKPMVNTLLENTSVQLVQFQNNDFYQNETFKTTFNGSRKYYVMNEHLYPDGSNQVLDLNLPHALLSLLWGDENEQYKMDDQRVMALAQALPIMDEKQSDSQVVALKEEAPEQEKHDLHWWLWGALIALFLLERFIGIRVANS